MAAPEVWGRRVGAPIVTQTFAERALEDGREFHVSRIFNNVADDGRVSVFVDNPSDSDTDMAITAVRVSGTGSAEHRINTNVTQSVAGTSLPIYNGRVTEPEETSVATVERGGTYSGRATDPFIQVILAGGGAGGQRSGTGAQDPSFVLREGNNMLIELTNISGGTEDFSISLFWVEESAV